MRQNWQLWEGILSDEQCDSFEEMCKHIQLRDATIFKDKGLGADKEIRIPARSTARGQPLYRSKGTQP